MTPRDLADESRAVGLVEGTCRSREASCSCISSFLTSSSRVSSWVSFWSWSSRVTCCVASRVVVELALRSLAAGLKMEKPIQNEWIDRWIEASWISESAGAGFAERLLRDQATPPGQPCWSSSTRNHCSSVLFCSLLSIALNYPRVPWFTVWLKKAYDVKRLRYWKFTGSTWECGRKHARTRNIDPIHKGVSLFLSYTNMNKMNGLHQVKEHP